MKFPQSVAIIGSGAVGSYYGGRLAEAGHDVRFLFRRDYHAVTANGLRVESPEGNFTLEHPHVYRRSEEIGTVDWVVCALKATSMADARALVQPCIAPKTRILVLMNGLGLEDDFAAWFGGKHIFGGLAFTCINRGKPGYIHHLGYGTVNIGHYQDDPAELEEAKALWAGSKTTITTAPCLLRARWEKLCWNIPFSGLAVAAGGITTDRIMDDPGLRQAARTLMQEVIAAGNADLEQHGEKARIDGPSLTELMFQNTSTMGPYKPSTMIDFVDGRSMEIESIFGEPLRRAEALKIPAPQLTLLAALLRAHNSSRK